MDWITWVYVMLDVVAMAFLAAEAIRLHNKGCINFWKPGLYHHIIRSYLKRTRVCMESCQSSCRKCRLRNKATTTTETTTSNENELATATANLDKHV